MDDLLVKPLQVVTLRSALVHWLPELDEVQAAPVAGVQAEAPLLDRSALAPFDRLRPGSSLTLLGIYLKDLAGAEAALEQAVADGDLNVVARTSHKLKGASLTVGARALGGRMKELGQHARDGSLPTCQDCWRQAQTLLADTRQAILAICAPPTP